MALPFQTTLRWATEADFDALGEVMFAAVREGASPYTEAQRQAWVPKPRRGAEWRTRLRSQEIIVAEANGRLLGFMSLAEGGYVDFAYIRAEARGAGLFRELFKRILDLARAKGLPLLLGPREPHRRTGLFSAGVCRAETRASASGR